MPLRDILLDIEKDEGQTADTSEQAVRIAEINNATREIHASTDLPEAIDEQVFDFNGLASPQIVLPYYVDKVKAMRYADSRSRIDIDSGQNRYNYPNVGENEVWFLQWRDRGVSALQQDLNNQSTLTFKFPTGITNSAAFTVTIKGKTDKAHRITEVISFATTDNEKESTNNWLEIESIVKSVLIDYDLEVYDAADTLVAVLANSEYSSQYRNYQIIDTDAFTAATSQSGVEVRYKMKFMPFKDDQDTYFGTDRYDKAIYWKYMEIRAKDAEAAVAYHQKCRQVLVDLINDQTQRVKSKINFAPTYFFGMPYGRFANYRGRTV